MTDLEISKALALAIGWIPRRVGQDAGNIYVDVSTDYTWHNDWRVFDYRDWNVIGPIADKFDCFPRLNGTSGCWSCNTKDRMGFASADTPQKAIAMAVINGAKK